MILIKMTKKITLTLLSLLTIGLIGGGINQTVSARAVEIKPALVATGPVFENPDGPTVNANMLDISKKIPVMCENYFDGCNQCMNNENWMSACTMMWCEVNEAPKCTKRKWYEKDEKPYYIKLNLDEASCKAAYGGMYNGDNRCYFKRPKVYSLAEIQNLADYDNWNLRVDLSKENCEKNGWTKTLDWNWIEICLIDLAPISFDECVAVHWKTTKSIPAQCSYGSSVFVQDMKDVLKNDLSENEKDLADSFDKNVDKKTEGMSDLDKNEYKTKLKGRIDKIINFVEYSYKSLFLYIKELL